MVDARSMWLSSEASVDQSPSSNVIKPFKGVIADLNVVFCFSKKKKKA